MTNNPVANAAEVLKANIYYNLATVSSTGGPWSTPVYAELDNQLTIYWRSWIRAQHSQNITDNSKVHISVYDTNRKLGTNHQRCVYFECKATEVKDPLEIDEKLLLFSNNNSTSDEFISPSQKRLYRATPIKAWVNDKSENQVDAKTENMRLEISLEFLRKALVK